MSQYSRVSCSAAPGSDCCGARRRVSSYWGHSVVAFLLLDECPYAVLQLPGLIPEHVGHDLEQFLGKICKTYTPSCYKVLKASRNFWACWCGSFVTCCCNLWKLYLSFYRIRITKNHYFKVLSKKLEKFWHSWKYIFAFMQFSFSWIMFGAPSIIPFFSSLAL